MGHTDMPMAGLIERHRADPHGSWVALWNVVCGRIGARSSAEDRSYYRAFARRDEPEGMVR